MKALFANLFALLPPYPSKLSVPELVDQATAYVKQLQKRMGEYKEMKVQLEKERSEMRSKMIPPVLYMRDLGSNLEVHLITGLSILELGLQLQAFNRG
ncbi:hypothetical protein COLO4_24159 [Corchorus olitorius]|uniref:BHLH domain-containing protein n=1 Tax=Corchorus olitorius TaxID=93759 RepID=A0A1R3ICH6_9ROSI|nr:hypothetical protein COLO4_24159 [Corchorus olitorius]